MSETKSANLLDLRSSIRSCTSCDLHKQRVYPVVGGGSTTSKILFIEEFPSWRAEQTDTNMSGPAGRIFHAALYQAGYELADYFVTSVVHCRPSEGGPTLSQLKTCAELFISPTLQVSGASLVVCLGLAATRFLTGETESQLSRLRGKKLTLKLTKQPAFCTFHPHYVATNKRQFTSFVKDLKQAMRFVKSNGK